MPAHVYTAHDGTPIPSVSTVVSQLRSSYRSKAIEEAAILGSLAHRLVERSLLGETVTTDDVPESVGCAFDAWSEWRFARSPEVERVPDDAGGVRLASELSLVTPPAIPAELAYGGTLDLVVGLRGRRVVVDLKTRTTNAGRLPTPERVSLLQVAAYGFLWECAYPARRLNGALVLAIGRNEAVYRECWLTRPQLEARMREFVALRTALAEHEACKVDVRETRKAERKAGRTAA